MKILYHHRTRAEDAQGIHIREMIHAFRKLGHSVEVVGMVSLEEQTGKSGKPSLINRLASHMPSLGYEIMEVLYNFYGFYLLCKRILSDRPNVIYERYALHTVAGIVASKVFGIPLILEVNAPLAYEKVKYADLALPWLARYSERWICSNARRTIVVSTPLKRVLVEAGVPPEKIVVIPNGINPEIFNPTVSGDEIRTAYALYGKTVLGFVGWFREWHGLEELLKSYVNCGMKEKGIHLLLVGDGPAYGELESFARDNGIMGTGVTFTGPVARGEVPKYIAAFDLALQPDVTEYASPIKLFEYMAMGKGVIAPDKENIKEILKDTYQALFRAGDWNDMARKILEYGASQEEARKLGALARNIIDDNRHFWTENARRALGLI